MKLTSSLTFFLASLVLLCTSLQASLLVDGNFDLANTGTQVSNSPWVLAANQPDGTNNGAQFQTGFANAQNSGVGGPQAPGTGTGVWFRGFEGNQDPGDPTVTAFLFQNVTAPADGDYDLSFVAGREADFTAIRFDVTFWSTGTGGSTSVDLLAAAIPDGGGTDPANLGGAASVNPGGTPFSLSLSGVTAGDTLSVLTSVVGARNPGSPPASGFQSAFVDSFVLVPEPTAASMILLGMLGLALRRRR